MPKSKWKDENYIKVYVMARQGMTNESISKALGVGGGNFKIWVKERPALKYALEEGREAMSGEQNGVESFHNYVYNQLPDHLRLLWQKINDVANEENGIKRMEAILQSQGKYARMHLFLYALVAKNFNISAACRTVNIALMTYRYWLQHEPHFAELMDEMEFHKKNFLEAALLKSVKKGDVSAIIFANRTQNRDRGYNEKVEIEHTGHIHSSHSAIDVGRMPFELRKQVLAWLRDDRSKKEAEALKLPTPVLEYELKDKVAVPVEESEVEHA